MEIKYDEWQQEILDYKGDILLIKGRRIGATEIFSIKGGKRMVDEPGVKIVFISLTEEQAKLCISVTHEWLQQNHPKMIGTGKYKPQLGALWVRHGKKPYTYSSMRVRAVGDTGRSIRGFDGDVLGVDEAPWQPQKMWRAARPIISTNDGEIWMWGTPDEDEGYFYEQFDKAYNNKDPEARFKVWYKNTEEVLEERPICESWTQKQQDGLRRILKEEKKDMSELEYGNEYLGKFLSQMRRIYNDDWIDKQLTLDPTNHKPTGTTALGVDIAGMGDDISTFEGLERIGNKILQFHHETTKKTMTTDTEDKILSLNERFDLDHIGIDDGGIGAGVLAHLLKEDDTKRKVVGLNNAKRPIDYDGRTTKLQKETMYYNLLRMGERGELALFDCEEIRRALKSIKVLENGHIKGRWDHIVEGLIRAAELLKEKDLNPIVYTIKV